MRGADDGHHGKADYTGGQRQVRRGLYVFGIASAIVLPIAVYLLLAGGKAAQAGRGILIGYLATPLTAAIVIIPIVVVTLLLH